MSFGKGAEGSRSREQTRGEGQEYGGPFGQLPDKESRDDGEVACRV